MSDLERLQQTLQSLVSNLSTDKRAQVMRKIAEDLRLSNRKRIQEQKNPDGSKFARRKSKKRDKNGRIKRKMFSKIRTNKYLKTKHNANEAEIEFSSAVTNIAEVHHFGLRDKITNRISVQYEKRELLGITDTERNNMIDLFLEHLTRP